MVAQARGHDDRKDRGDAQVRFFVTFGGFCLRRGWKQLLGRKKRQLFPTGILQKHDIAEVAIVQTRPTLKVMKTRFGIKNWIIPLLGIGLVAGTVVTTTSYCNLEQKTHDAEALSATLGRLYEDQQMNLVLKSVQDGDTKEAARRLDILLCNSILRLDEELASSDERTLAFVQDAFRRMALVRPEVATSQAAAPEYESFGYHAAARKVLSRTLASAETAQAR
jgi:hypothetical protein